MERTKSLDVHWTLYVIGFREMVFSNCIRIKIVFVVAVKK